MQKELEEFLYEEAKNQIPPIIRQTEELFEDKEFCEKYMISNESILTNENLENAKPINLEFDNNPYKKAITTFKERVSLAEEYEAFIKKSKKGKFKIKDCPLTVITFMVLKGYHKIKDNEVVISKEEKQKLLKEMYEQGKFDAIADLEKEGKVVIGKEELESMVNAKMKCISDMAIIARKETAEKILKEIRGYYPCSKENCEKYESFIIELCEDLAKEFGVDLGE